MTADPTHPDRLTALSHGAGCACKLGLDVLDQILAAVPADVHPRLSVGVGDDAAVWDAGDRSMVLTTDFFTPIVDDAATWGRIAATNAASDVFAMGASPVVALNLVGWPADRPTDELTAVLAGAREAAASGGWIAVGGHSIDSPEPFFGQAVLGEATGPPLTQAGAREGDVLVLTAPIGTGIVVTAAKRSPRADVAPGGPLHEPHAAAVAVMTRHNRDAAAAARDADVRAATDVTGFGLLGHLHRLASASGVGATVDPTAVPLLPRVAELAAAGHVPGGTRRNVTAVRERAGVDGDAAVLELLADAQTSGGLLLACPPDTVEGLRADLRSAGDEAAVIGRCVAGPAGSIRLTD
jgi:selenide,water dikinase